MPSLKLNQLADLYAITRLPPDTPTPAWLAGDGISSYSRGSEEVTLICPQLRVPENVLSDRDWACFEAVGPFSLGEAGILLSLLRPLSENDIGIFLIPTFSTDYLLIKASDVNSGRRYLMAAGHTLL
jgi:hypothetical protein